MFLVVLVCNDSGAYEAPFPVEFDCFEDAVSVALYMLEWHIMFVARIVIYERVKREDGSSWLRTALNYELHNSDNSGVLLF